MSLRQKSLFFILGLCLILITAVYSISRGIILTNFQSLEEQNTNQNLERVQNAIDAKINALDTFTQDYAGWDDTYAFIEDANKEYIESNLVDETFSGTKINMMVFINNEGEIIYSKMYDLKLNQSLPLTNDFKPFISAKSQLLSHESLEVGKSGVVLLQNDPMIVVSRPILTSEKQGPARGSLIMGKYINKGEILELRKNTGLDLSILRSDAATLLPAEALALKTNGKYISPNNNEMITGYKSINDINGNPALYAKIILPRSIYIQGKQAMYYLVGSLIIISILAVVIAILYLDRILLKPLKTLVLDVNTIRSTADFSTHVHEGGKGEISELAKDINKMINSLASGEKALRVVNKEIEFEKANVEKIVEERTQELKAEQVRFIASINSVYEGFILLDTNSKVVMTNHVVSHIFNTEHQDWPFDKIQLALKDSFDFSHAYNLCMQHKEAAKYNEVTFNDKVLKIFFAPVFIAPKTGNLAGTVVTIEDITEAKKLERSKDEFFSIASHELRTPLTAIKGNTQMMQKYFSDKVNDKNFTGMLNDLYASSIRLIEIVNIFLTTSRLEQGKIEFDIKPFDMNELLAVITNRMQTTAQARGLALNFKPSESPIMTLADKNRTEEVILNLISNSINYTEKGSVTISAIQKSDETQVSVEDTGKGISPNDQPLLFRKFQQINDTLYTRDVSRGTGLGLYISRLMIEAMKGKIYIERSEVYKGSVFTFTLPLNKTQEK
jgi:sensor domain CHASE-containing protein/nitrogen-specific signal transduction histidine kinase